MDRDIDRGRENDATDVEWSQIQSVKAFEWVGRKKSDARLKQLRFDLTAAETALTNSDGDDATRLTMERDSLRNQVSTIEKFMQDEEKMLQTAQAVNRCENGYCYQRVAGGYRCDGGGHFVSDSEIRHEIY